MDEVKCFVGLVIGVVVGAILYYLFNNMIVDSFRIY